METDWKARSQALVDELNNKRAEFFLTAAHTNGNRYKLFQINVVAD